MLDKLADLRVVLNDDVLDVIWFKLQTKAFPSFASAARLCFGTV